LRNIEKNIENDRKLHKEATEMVFPNARNFKRPGFDDINY